MKIFAIRDLKADGFNRPFPSSTRGTAMREISVGLLKDEQMQVFAEDFALFELAEFQPESGHGTWHDSPLHVIDISELVPASDGLTVETTPKLGVA